MPDPQEYEGYLRARVDFLAQQVAELRASTRENLQEVKTDILRQEERLKATMTDSERRSLDRLDQLARTMVEQNAQIRDALRADREQWLSAIERLQPFQRYILMILGALALLSWFAKPLIEKLFRP